jgi:hypothetical protein
MANTKISALTGATTPLAGTEVLPIVQSSATVKVSVANVTAGRAVDAASYASTGGATFATTSGVVAVGTTPKTWSRKAIEVNDAAASYVANTAGGATVVACNMYFNSGNKYATTAAAARYSCSTGIHEWYTAASGSADAAISFGNPKMDIAETGDVSIGAGNLIPKTAAKGINFTANTGLAGMTSQLLNWYEEGTWTPNQGAGLTLVGAFSSTGRYTRIGRQVSISGTVTGATSVAVTAAGVITSNLPFTVVTAGHGGATNVANNASSTVICTSTSVTSASAIAATATITFSATYFV